MRRKISITLSANVLAEIDRGRDRGVTCSAFIEQILRAYFDRRDREAINRRDLELINANIECLSRQAEDSLQDQASIDFSAEEE